MFARTLFLAAIGLLASIELAGCAGAGGSAPPPASVTASSNNVNNARSSNDQVLMQSVDVRVGATPTTATLPLTQGLSGSITLRSTGSNATVKIGTEQPAASGRATPLSLGGCPPVPPIVISNPFPFPITIAIDAFTVRLPCSVNGLLYGASSYQSNPVPQTLVSTKLGDATGAGHTITFTPKVSQLTFPAKSALTISILPETSTAFAQLPAIANAATVLTSNAPAVPNSLSLSSPNVQGGATFQSACYLPNDPAGPGLPGIHILGIASFYCVLVPGQPGTSTTFGGQGSKDIVTFRLGPNAKPDASYVGLDGPPLYAACTPAAGGQVCDSVPFEIPVYSKAIVGNVAALEACVPTVENADCNGVAGNPKAPSATNVPRDRDFQLLFADDPSYNAPNTFGGVTLQVGGTSPSCTINIGPDANNDVPPGYADPAPSAGATPLLANYAGAGPYVEFDIKATTPGTCLLGVTEDTGLKRTFAFAIPVRSSW